MALDNFSDQCHCDQPTNFHREHARLLTRFLYYLLWGTSSVCFFLWRLHFIQSHIWEHLCSCRRGPHCKTTLVFYNNLNQKMEFIATSKQILLLYTGRVFYHMWPFNCISCLTDGKERKRWEWYKDKFHFYWWLPLLFNLLQWKILKIGEDGVQGIWSQKGFCSFVSYCQII